MSSYGFVAPVDWEAVRHLAGPPMDADRVRASGGGTSDALLSRLRSDVLVDLADAPGFRPHGFYDRLEDTGVGVAGFKNRPGEINALFVLTHCQDDGLYDCVPRPLEDRLTAPLVDRLFLGRRTFAGLRVLPRAPALPAFDDPMLLGVLSPTEAQMLAWRLPVWEARLDGGGNPHFRRFAERCQAAAAARCGLIAMHGMACRGA